MRKAITGLAIVSLVAGLALVAVSLSQTPSAAAQETEDEVFSRPLEDVLDDLVKDEVITKDQRDKIAEAFEDRMVRFGRGFRGTPHLETVAKALEMDVDELAEKLRDGSTIADIAGDQTQGVIDALVDEQATRIDDAIAEGRISEEKAAEIREALTGQIEAMVNGDCSPGVHPFGMDHRRGPGGMLDGPRGFDFFGGPRGLDFFDGPNRLDRFGFGRGLGLDSIAEALGLEADELMEQLADGSSLAEIAEEQGVEIQDIVDSALAGLDEQLDDLVADERLTRERADEIRDGLAAGIESMITGEMPGFDGFHFEFKFDDGEGFPDFRGPGHGFPFPDGFFGSPDAVNGSSTSA
jgi:DNA-binding ferritin-like protein